MSKLREVVRDRKAWRVAVHGVSKSQTQLSDWTTTTNQTKPKQIETLTRTTVRVNAI